MPVNKVPSAGLRPSPHTAIWRDLAAELRSPKPFGQPTVTEELFERTGLIGVTVFWDRLQSVVDVERPDVILRAYADVDQDRAKQVAFAIGYTTDEAVEAGLLRYTVKAAAKIPELRTQCWAALRELGASSVRIPPVIRCDSLAEACRYREALLKLVPGSELVWHVDGPDVPDGE